MPYLDNPSEEIRSGSSQINEQHETKKFINEEVIMQQQKRLKP